MSYGRIPQLLSEFEKDRLGWSGRQHRVAWESTGPYESWPPLHRSRSSPHDRFCVCDLKACHLLLFLMLSASSLFSVLRGHSYPRPLAPFLLCHLPLCPPGLASVLFAFTPSLLGKNGIQGGVNFRDGPVLATEAWSWAWSAAVCRLSETRCH